MVDVSEVMEVMQGHYDLDRRTTLNRMRKKPDPFKVLIGCLVSINIKDEVCDKILEELFSVIQDRKEEMPEGSYTTQLFNEGVERIAQKVIEEAGETAIAGATVDREGTVREMSDLLYHSLVLLSALGAKPEDVWEDLRSRRG